MLPVRCVAVDSDLDSSAVFNYKIFITSSIDDDAITYVAQAGTGFMFLKMMRSLLQLLLELLLSQ